MDRTIITIVILVVLAACQGGQEAVPEQGIVPGDSSAAPVAPPGGDVFVHLFEWDWPSVAQECEEFLAPAGYDAVQVSPPQEHAEGPEWWTRYQPVSYKLESRGGTREEFADMVERCAAVGVDIYVDAVINHMTGVRSGTGVAGSPYGEYEYPGLYGYDDFNHCDRNDGDDIVDFDDVWEVQNCELINLADLKTDDPGVRATLAGFLNDMLTVGVAGFRIDAAKHMPPADIAAIIDELDTEAYVFQEVIATIDGPIDRDAYLAVADVTEFQYQPPVQRAFSDGDLEGLERLGPGIGLLPADRAVVFVDNHDTQRHGGDHGFNYRLGDRYVLANVFMLAWPYGYPKVMSSFDFEERDQGPPDTRPIDGCGQEWVCEHRMYPIAKMVVFRSATAGAPVTRWQRHGDAAFSFGRGDKGHVVINIGDEPLDVRIETSLPPGDYGNLVSQGADRALPGVTVNADGAFNAQLGPLTALVILQ